MASPTSGSSLRVEGESSDVIHDDEEEQKTITEFPMEPQPYLSSMGSSLLSSYSEISFDNQGIVFVGPSGVGKETLITAAKNILEKHDLKLPFVVSHTTRDKRETEKDGVEYHFVTKEAFLELQAAGGFVESRRIPGIDKYYGTSKKAIEDASGEGSIPIFDIDITALKIIEEEHPEYNFLKIFVTVPGEAVEEKLSVTRRRLELRGTESAQEIDKRQKNAITAYAEFEANRHLFDHELVNDDLNEAVEHLTSNLKTIQTRVNERGHNHSFLLNHQLEFAIKNGAQIPENLSPKQLLFLHARNLLPMDFQKPPIKYNTNFKVTERLVTEFGYTISPSLFNDINLLCFALKNGTKNLQRKEPIKFHDNLYDIEYLVVEHEFQISQDFLVNCNTSFLEILSEKWIDFLMNHGARVPNFKEWLDMTRNVKIEKMKTLQDTWDLFNRMLKELNPSDFSEYCSELLLLALKRNLHEAISILCRMEFYDGINACPNYQWCVSELEKSEMNHASFVSIQGCLYVMGKRDLADITNNAEWLKDPKGMAVHVRDLLCECVSCNVSLKLRDIFGFLRPAAVKKYGECDVFVWKKRMEQDFFDDLEESIECDDLDDLMKLEWCVGLNVFVRKMDDQVDIVWVSSIAEVVELFVDGVECLARLIEEYCGLSQTVRMNFFKNRVLHGKKKRRERAIVKLAADVERNFFCVYTRWERVSNESGFRVALFRVGSGGVSSLMCGGSVV